MVQNSQTLSTIVLFFCLSFPRHHSLYPRVSLYLTHIFWDKKNNPEPWSKLDPTYQYKLVAVNTDYKSLKKDRPDF
uniref:Uncharacterized protein n=1 Tax=Oryzias melastigma TaxID=30732 RepID=A0A3B3CG92_ORYME